MPTTRRLETPSADRNGAAVVFEYREGDDAATISTTRGRLVTLTVDELRELEDAILGALIAVGGGPADQAQEAPDQRGELDQAGA